MYPSTGGGGGVGGGGVGAMQSGGAGWSHLEGVVPAQRHQGAAPGGRGGGERGGGGWPPKGEQWASYGVRRRWRNHSHQPHFASVPKDD